jgi:hypothetical protein
VKGQEGGGRVRINSSGTNISSRTSSTSSGIDYGLHGSVIRRCGVAPKSAVGAVGHGSLKRNGSASASSMQTTTEGGRSATQRSRSETEPRAKTGPQYIRRFAFTCLVTLPSLRGRDHRRDQAGLVIRDILYIRRKLIFLRSIKGWLATGDQ